MTTIQRIRPEAVAGSFYPRPADVLRREVDQMLASAPLPDAAHELLEPPVAMIVPHAGYVYSGPVAARAYALLRPWHDTIRRAVVIGPTHRVFVSGLAVSSADGFHTPLGDIPIDVTARDRVLSCAGVHINDAAHEREHSLEVHLPFLQRVLDDGWSLVPIIVGDADARSVAEVLASLWGEPGTVVIVSTDLSHYHDHSTAQRLDRATAATIAAGQWEALDGERACGVHAVSGALEVARRRRDHIDLIDLRDSSETTGPEDRVVGYGSFVIRSALNRSELATLLDVAQHSVRAAASGEPSTQIDPRHFPPALRTPGAAFVTLERHGRLRGCIGTLSALEPLVTCVADRARAATLDDPRFPPVTQDELADLEVSVSVLSTPRPLATSGYDDLLSRVQPGVDGLVVDCRRGRATLLPAVWDDLPDAPSFVAALWSKAGLDPGEWPADIRVSRYCAQHT